MYLAQNVKRLRKERKWTQAELADKIGAHLSHINRVETGKYIPSLETIIEIAKALEVPIDHLVNNSEGNLVEIKIEDQTFAEKIKLLNTLDEEERLLITKMIDALLTKKQILEFLTKGNQKVLSK